MTLLAKIAITWLMDSIVSWVTTQIQRFKRSKEIESEAKDAADKEKSAESSDDLDGADGDLISGRVRK